MSYPMNGSKIQTNGSILVRDSLTTYGSRVYCSYRVNQQKGNKMNTYIIRQHLVKAAIAAKKLNLVNESNQIKEIAQNLLKLDTNTDIDYIFNMINAPIIEIK